jgi:3-methyladenine DNA glycosylase AlkD
VTEFVALLRDALREQANPANAGPMQKYMKSAMPYLGIKSTPLALICREHFAVERLDGYQSWRDAVLVLWRDAEYREERYAAIALARHRFYGEYQQLKALSMYREMIVTGAWWDYVDNIAEYLVGGLLRGYPRQMGKTLRAWARGDDMWLRRSAIICQMHFKAETDLRLLYNCIEPSMESREFFLRKAIGWALRQYARIDAREVRRYVKANRSRLSGLSQREALKALERARARKEALDVG